MSVVASNTWYIDGTDTLSDNGNIRVSEILLTPTAANAVLLLADNNSAPSTKIDLRAAVSGETRQFSFSERPLIFQKGVKVVTLTNAVATIIFERSPA